MFIIIIHKNPSKKCPSVLRISKQAQARLCETRRILLYALQLE
jgi:hypothetical protein